MRDCTIGGLGLDGRPRSLVGGGRRCGGAAVELVGLVCERAPPGVHLQQQRLRRLPGEPELSALGVVAVALDRDRDAVTCVEQALGRHEPRSVEQSQSGGVAGGELTQRAGVRERRCVGRRRTMADMTVRLLTRRGVRARAA